MQVYFAPDGITHVLEEKPEGYFTVEEWEEIHPPPPPFELQPPTPEQIQKSLTAAVQNYLDAKVKERGYNDFLFITTYINSANPLWQAEALACIAWRDIVWQTYHNIINKVTAGQCEIPTIKELIAELPELIWPEAIANLPNTGDISSDE